TDQDAHWRIRVEDVPSSPPTVDVADARQAAPGAELRLRVWPPPGHRERLSITVYSEQGTGALELASSARWLAPDLVAFTLPDALVADVDHRGKVGVALALPGAYEPRVTQCEGPRTCVLEGDGFIRDVMTHIVYVPLAP
ncbi:MAG TPA: hypothetical protein VLT33_08955, partial [Labilithrix sp.]|nr:hypothetical protein [Labilithrix sp.]